MLCSATVLIKYRLFLETKLKDSFMKRIIFQSPSARYSFLHRDDQIQNKIAVGVVPDLTYVSFCFFFGCGYVYLNTLIIKSLKMIY